MTTSINTKTERRLFTNFNFFSYNMPNLCFNSDKYPANYCSLFNGSEVVLVFNFVVGTCALSE